MKKMLFLCTGNYYRSRFAEIYFNKLAQDRGLDWKAESRGLALDHRNPGPISRHTLSALKRLEICADAYLRDPLAATRADFDAADHVVAVKEAEHRSLITRDFRECLSKVEFWHVHDLDCALPEEAIPHLQQLVERLVDRLAKEDVAAA